jgi:hypothetical protein
MTNRSSNARIEFVLPSTNPHLKNAAKTIILISHGARRNLNQVGPGERLTGEMSQIFVSFENWILWSAMTSERLFWRHNHENN